MLRFNLFLHITTKALEGISIHLMLRFNVALAVALHPQYLHFNTSYVAVQRRRNLNICIRISISIHLMLRFNLLHWNILQRCKRFQYILCCGSTKEKYGLPSKKVGFQYILCCGSTPGTLAQNFSTISFQYILCCGSTY